MARGFIGAALWMLACGGSVTGPTGEVGAGGTTSTGGDSSNTGGKLGAATGGLAPTSGGAGGTGGTSKVGGIDCGGDNRYLPICQVPTTSGGAGGVSSSGGAVSSGGIVGTGGDNTAGASTGGAETCGSGGCIPDSNAPPVTPPGPVLCGGVLCAAPRACCLSTSQCYDPTTNPDACARPAPDNDLWGRPTCASNAQCGARQFCIIDSGFCQGTGHCNPIGNCGSCSASGSTCRVCGCDGNTYPNIQTACLASATMVSIWGAGCGETIDTDGGRGAGGASDGGAPRLVTLCGSSNDCKAGELCCPITGLCYPTSDPDQCRMPPPGTRFPCTSDAQCNSSEYCSGDGCSGPGGCVVMGSQGDCGVTFEPVCGCDGTTYTSAACASVRGVRVASKGQCVAADH